MRELGGGQEHKRGACREGRETAEVCAARLSHRALIRPQARQQGEDGLRDIRRMDVVVEGDRLPGRDPPRQGGRRTRRPGPQFRGNLNLVSL